ncbi:MAG: Helix-turn-helix domain [Chthoniobacter sp.]|nr:Helix-turn-helix domain [Chthoniobacter sp.]
MKSPTLSQHASTDQLESRREVAARVRCHPKTIARAEVRGELTPIKFNSRLIRYRRSDVDRWIADARSVPENRTISKRPVDELHVAHFPVVGGAQS